MNNLTTETIRAALLCIPADLPRDEWAKIGMALKSELGDAGFDLFDAWSQSGANYKATATRETWRSVKAGGRVTIGTLLHTAKANGFQLDTTNANTGPTPEQRETQAQARTDRAERDQREQAERDETHRHAAAEAVRLWGEAAIDGESPYLLRKGVQGYGVRYAPGGWLLVPMRDASGELWNVQRIAPAKPADGPDKLFLKGGRKSELLHWCGEPANAPALLMAEGYATAASIHEATGRPVAAAFDAGNLVHVARALRKQHPAALMVLCADDDRDTKRKTGKNPGRDKASEVAKAVRGVVVVPASLPEGGSDFNDMHAHAGLDAVRECIENAIQQAQQRGSAAGNSEASNVKDAPGVVHGKFVL